MSQVHNVMHVPVHSPLSGFDGGGCLLKHQGRRCGQERGCYETRKSARCWSFPMITEENATYDYSFCRSERERWNAGRHGVPAQVTAPILTHASAVMASDSD